MGNGSPWWLAVAGAGLCLALWAFWRVCQHYCG